MQNKDHISKFHGIWNHDAYLLDTIKAPFRPLPEPRWMSFAVEPCIEEFYLKFFSAKVRQIREVTKQIRKKSENLQGGEDVRFSITAEQDAEYMKAVESGDMEKAGRMVKAAFKARFPWVSAPVPLTLGL